MEIGLTDLNRLYIEAKTKFRMTMEETYTILTVPESIYIYIYDHATRKCQTPPKMMYVRE